MEEWTAQVTFMNVGNGDAILIEAPDPERRDSMFVMVIDGGSGEQAEYAVRSTGRLRAVDYMEKRGIKHIDIMVCTHIHEDHTCGLLPIALKWCPKFLWQPFPAELSDIMKLLNDGTGEESGRKLIAALNGYAALCRYVKAQGGRVIQAKPGYPDSSTMFPANGIRIHILGPAEEALDRQTARLKALYQEGRRDLLPALDRCMNSSSMILHIACGEKTFLLAGDAEASDYEACRGDIKADVFKVGHHGQANSLTPEILQAVSPQYAVICASSDRRYESAAPSVLEQLYKSGIPVYYSDCPTVAPFADKIEPHTAAVFRVMRDGRLYAAYNQERCITDGTGKS